MTDNITHRRLRQLEARVRRTEEELGLVEPELEPGDEEDDEPEAEKPAPSPQAAKKRRRS